MIAINDASLEAVITKLQDNGWKGDRKSFIAMISESNKEASDNIGKENIFIRYNEEFQFCEKYIYSRGYLTDSICNVYKSNDVIIFVERPDNLGGCLENNFDKGFKSLVSTFKDESIDLTHFKFIYLSRISKCNVTFDNYNWYLDELSGFKDHDLLKKLKNEASH